MVTQQRRRQYQHYPIPVDLPLWKDARLESEPRVFVSAVRYSTEQLLEIAPKQRRRLQSNTAEPLMRASCLGLDHRTFVQLRVPPAGVSLYHPPSGRKPDANQPSMVLLTTAVIPVTASSAVQYG